MTSANALNPLLALDYEPVLAALGEDYFDVVAAAEFPSHRLRFRNDRLLPQLGLDPQSVSDEQFIEAFGKFQGREPFLALRYHGYQFGEYNPFLGDGRGFLYGQVRGRDGELYDLGTKGSGRTPYSRGADGKLTLKGGVREVLAAEALHELGVRTSRCLSLIETGEALWRGDEPSPTRASVMVRFSRSHIRFGTFERLHHLRRPDLIQTLLNHVVEQYYPALCAQPDCYAQFYAELVKRVAELVAQWMSVGFCHAVLNTDNLSITGESFDYGPYAFIDRYDLRFTAAYFDHSGRYSYGSQPGICRLNLELLQRPLAAVIPLTDLEAGLDQFAPHYHWTYHQRMLNKLGFEARLSPDLEDLLELTLQFLSAADVGYHGFFAALTQQFDSLWRDDPGHILSQPDFLILPNQTLLLDPWRKLYHRLLNDLPEHEMARVAQRLHRHNPMTVLLRPDIEAVWEPIVQADNWQPLAELLQRLRLPHQPEASLTGL